MHKRGFASRPPKVVLSHQRKAYASLVPLIRAALPSRARSAMTQRREYGSSGSVGRSRSPARRPDTEDIDRSLEELARLGWTKRKALRVLQMYDRWGYDEISRDIQTRTKNGFISLREAQRIATGTPNPREPATEGMAVHDEE